MADLITGFFSLELAGSYLFQYFEAIVVFILSLALIKLFKSIIIYRLESLAKKTKNEFDDTIIEIIKGIGFPFYLVVALYASSLFLDLPSTPKTALHFLLIIIVTFYGIRSIQKIAQFLLKKSLSEKAGKGITGFFSGFLKIILWSIALLLILANMGYNINALIAGLGVMGIAVAFALQKVLEDIFSAFTIYFDKPFEVGDFIIIGDDLGTVKDIGLKSTRIITLHGQELVISNHEITSTRINNYKKMKKRRITFSFGVTYETSTKKLDKIPKIMKKILDKIKLAELDRIHFKSFGDFSLVYEVVYYMLISDYNKYMDVQQEINLNLKKEFEKEKIEFAYPTQTLYLSKMK